MVERNQAGFLKKFLSEYPISGWLESLRMGRILNVGAKDYGPWVLFKEFLNGQEVLGIDISLGKGVDLICDMEGDCKELKGEKFSMVICCSMLEHCARPWIAAQNIEKHLLPFGLLYVTVPWVWRTHNYPKDYWRMSPDAIKILFPNIIWKRIGWSTQNENEFIKYDADHDEKEPWRIIRYGRAHIVVHQVHMIGRMS